MSNRQRRAAKQRRRQARPTTGGRVRDGQRPPTMAELVWAAVDVLHDEPAAAGAVLDALADMPAGFAPALATVLAEQEARMTAHGWTADDLAEVTKRRVKVPAGASPVERDLRRLAFLVTMPVLPTVEPPRPTAVADAGMLAKIRALLAKAESTTFPEEAEALSTKAQELMARHRIDHVLVGDLDGEGDGPVGRRIWLDDPYADAKSQLLATVAAANSCRAVLLSGLGCVHIVGFASDLEVVELLHTSLLVQATSAMAAAGPQRDRRGRSRTRSFRQSFLVAYAWRIGERLRETTEEVTREVAARETSLLPALVRREERVEDAVARAFPGTERKTMSVTNPAGWHAGTVAADAADLSAGPGLDR